MRALADISATHDIDIFEVKMVASSHSDHFLNVLNEKFWLQANCSFRAFIPPSPLQSSTAQFGWQTRFAVSLTSASSPLSAIRVCHVAGDDERTGEDLVRREEAVQVPKYCVWSSRSLFMHLTFSPPRKQAEGNEIRARVCFTLSHSKGNIH